jgi:hypothetical protein
MAIYMVDRDLPRITSEGLAELQHSALLASQRLTAIGQPVRYIRSLFIPGEARCLCLFEAHDDATVVAVNELAGLPFTRIIAALDLSSSLIGRKYEQGGTSMDQICLVLPILNGKTEAARDFMGELEGTRKTEYDQSERRIGIIKEVWYIATLPSGDHFVSYMESPDFSNALSMFSQSRDAFDLWFKQHLADATGVDLNNPPPMQLPELLSNYAA